MELTVQKKPVNYLSKFRKAVFFVIVISCRFNYFIVWLKKIFEYNFVEIVMMGRLFDELCANILQFYCWSIDLCVLPL